eukprot:5965124-Pleurochrysis_carterae.AAC.2
MASSNWCSGSVATASASSLKPCASRKRAMRLCSLSGTVLKIEFAAPKSRRTTAVWYSSTDRRSCAPKSETREG